MSISSSNQGDWPSIGDFFANRDVFVTGASGFLGKCLVEKLLRSIPKIGHVMILLRSKKGKTVGERLKTVLESKCFDTIRETRPDDLKKVVPVVGNIVDPLLGINEEDVQVITENVSVVFNLAATVKFEAPIRESIELNVKSVRELVKLCKKMKKLVSLVHISTAFAHCNRSGTIEEIIYPPKVHPDKLLGLLDWMTDEQMEKISPTMLEDRPNTYTYTKAVAEYLLVNEARDLPFSIIRPSIVGGSYREPHPGWVDALHGPTGVFVAVGKGLLRVLRGNKFGIADIVPVDMLNNIIISIGWMTGVNPQDKPIIYQYTSGTVNPITWMELYPFVVSSYTTNPFDEIFRRPHLIKCRPESAWKIWHFFLHLIPGFFADLVLRIRGKKPRMIQIYKKMEAAIVQLDYFILNNWKWSYTNCGKLFLLLNDEDKVTFDFDIRKLDWNEYVKIFTMGTKTYLLNEDPANIPIARKQIKRLRNIRYTINVLIFLVATRLVYIKSSIARELWSSMLGFCIQMFFKLGRYIYLS